MLGTFGVASIIGALLVGPVRRRLGSENITGLGTLAFAAAELALAHSDGLFLALAGAAIGGLGWVIVLTTLNVAMQLRSPDAILGRCLSIYQAATFGGMALGAWFWGVIADMQEITTSLTVAATWLAASSILMRIWAPLPKRGEGVHIS